MIYGPCAHCGREGIDISTDDKVVYVLCTRCHYKEVTSMTSPNALRAQVLPAKWRDSRRALITLLVLLGSLTGTCVGVAHVAHIAGGHVETVIVAALDDSDIKAHADAVYDCMHIVNVGVAVECALQVMIDMEREVLIKAMTR